MKEARPEKSYFYYGVAGAQFVSFFAAFAGFMAEMLGENSNPMFIAACNGSLLATVYVPCIVKNKGFHLSTAWWKYALLAVIDIIATYFGLLALRFTSITSWALLQPFGFLAIVPLSILLLHAKYNWKHLASGFVAVGGLVILVLSDLDGEESSDHHSTNMVLLGDLLAILGTFSYGMLNVLVEVLLKGNTPQYEALGMLGSFGCIYGFSTAFLIGEISVDMFPKSTVPIYTGAAALSKFVVYSSDVFVLKHAGAAVFELSCLTMNLWSIFWKLTVMHSFHTNLIGFIISFAMIISGVTGFTLAGDPTEHFQVQYTALETEMPSQKTVEV